MKNSDNKARINIRLKPEEKKLIDQFAEANKMNVTQFIITSTINPLQLPAMKKYQKMCRQNTISEILNILPTLNLSTKDYQKLENELEYLWRI